MSCTVLHSFALWCVRLVAVLVTQGMIDKYSLYNYYRYTHNPYNRNKV